MPEDVIKLLANFLNILVVAQVILAVICLVLVAIWIPLHIMEMRDRRLGPADDQSDEDSQEGLPIDSDKQEQDRDDQL